MKKHQFKSQTRSNTMSVGLEGGAYPDVSDMPATLSDWGLKEGLG
jgi:hypothetical protein